MSQSIFFFFINDVTNIDTYFATLIGPHLHFKSLLSSYHILGVKL